MKTINMHDAKTHLSKLVDAAVDGEPFIIAKAGKPLVKVARVEVDTPRRTGFLKGQVDIPEDFDTMFEDEIRAILGENALQVYPFDEAKLRKVASEIGPRLSDIRAKPSETQE